MNTSMYGTAASNFTSTASQMKRNINNALNECKALYGAPINDKVALDEARDALVKLSKVATKLSQELEELASKESD